MAWAVMVHLQEIDLLAENPTKKTMTNYEEFHKYYAEESLCAMIHQKQKLHMMAGVWSGHIIDHVLDGSSSFFQNQKQQVKKYMLTLVRDIIFRL